MASLANVLSNGRIEVSMQLLEVIANNSFDSILMSGPNGLITYANKGFTVLTGYEMVDVLGKTAKFLQGEGTDKKVIARLDEVLKTGGDFEGTAINYKKDGTPFIMYWRVMPVKVGGDIKSWVAIQREGSPSLSENRSGTMASLVNVLSNGRIEMSTQLLEVLADNSFDSILMSDPEGLITYANKAFTALTGYEMAEVLGKTPKFLQGEGTDKKVIARLDEVLKTGGDFEGKAINFKKDGTPFVMYWRVVPAKVDGEIKGWVAIQREGY